MELRYFDSDGKPAADAGDGASLGQELGEDLKAAQEGLLRQLAALEAGADPGVEDESALWAQVRSGSSGMRVPVR